MCLINNSLKILLGAHIFPVKATFSLAKSKVLASSSFGGSNSQINPCWAVIFLLLGGWD